MKHLSCSFWMSPLEAELIKDPSMQCKVRFRFAGHEFPPFIVFKIFRNTGGQGSKYISGKRTISPASEAAVDACKLMGHRKYYDQMIWDELQYQNHKIIDEIDVATVKDYMQYISNLDETPAYFGGRDNCWRKLSLENFPRTMIMYDIMDYAQSGTLSNPLKEKLTFLLLRPQNEELRHDQLMTVSRVSLIFILNFYTLYFILRISKYVLISVYKTPVVKLSPFYIWVNWQRGV
uniref:Uncharacterized protein n=1 Tax=Gopherus evgoodei TaxID=1825980 RepID=A0A8C4XXU2_9SAUR